MPKNASFLLFFFIYFLSIFLLLHSLSLSPNIRIKFKLLLRTTTQEGEKDDLCSNAYSVVRVCVYIRRKYRNIEKRTVDTGEVEENGGRNEKKTKNKMKRRE